MSAESRPLHSPHKWTNSQLLMAGVVHLQARLPADTPPGVYPHPLVRQPRLVERFREVLAATETERQLPPGAVAPDRHALPLGATPRACQNGSRSW